LAWRCAWLHLSTTAMAFAPSATAAALTWLAVALLTVVLLGLSACGFGEIGGLLASFLRAYGVEIYRSGDLGVFRGGRFIRGSRLVALADRVSRFRFLLLFSRGFADDWSRPFGAAAFGRARFALRGGHRRRGDVAFENFLVGDGHRRAVGQDQLHQLRQDVRVVHPSDVLCRPHPGVSPRQLGPQDFVAFVLVAPAAHQASAAA